MKKLLVLTIGICLLLTSVPLEAQSEEAKQAVIKADRAREAALVKGDGMTWGKYVFDEFRFTNISTGEILQDKAQRVANITKNGPNETAKLSDEKFLIGETLVTQTGVYTLASGAKMRFARVWMKQDGKWLMAAIYVDSWPE